MTARKILSLLSVFVMLAAFSAGALAQIIDEESPAVDDKKTKTTTTQEVLTTLPTTAPGEKIEETVIPTENVEAKQLALLIEELTVCVEMKDRVMRLRCYDDLSTEKGLMKPAVKELERQKLQSYGFWQVTSELDQLGIETMFLSQSPYNKLSAPTLQTKIPVLNIRCRQGNTDVYLDWKSPLNAGRMFLKDIYIFNRIDSDEEGRMTWSLSLDAFAAFSPDPIEFIKTLRGKRKLQLRVTPYGGVTETLMFELGMLEQALDVMVKRCYAEGSAQEPPAPTRRLP